MAKAQYIISTLIHGSVAVPAKWVICPCCEGSGQVENAAFSSGFTSSEWADEDDDFKENYLSGGYDVACRECDATGKVAAPDMEQLTYPQKRLLATERSFQRQSAEFARECAIERRMGA